MQTRSRLDPTSIEAAAVIFDGEDKVALLLLESEINAVGTGILGGILQRLQATEVHGCFHIRSVSTGAIGVELDSQRRAPDLGLESCSQTLVRKEWGIDPTCQLAEGIQGFIRLSHELLNQWAHSLRIFLPDTPRQCELDFQRHEVLLGTIVNIPFQPPAFGVLR